MSEPVLCCEGSFDDWYVIERGYRRIADADVEGTGEEMLAIAEAIERRSYANFKRCAVATVTGGAELWSPRNSMSPAFITRDEADVLAASIREAVGRATKEPNHGG